jgi:hypothetical protein
VHTKKANQHFFHLLLISSQPRSPSPSVSGLSMKKPFQLNSADTNLITTNINGVLSLPIYQLNNYVNKKKTQLQTTNAGLQHRYLSPEKKMQ